MRLILTAAALASLAASPALALADPGGWKTSCDASGRCTAMLVVSDAQTKKVAGMIGVQMGKGGSDPMLLAVVPLGVALKPGFRAVIGTKAFDAPYDTCYPDGCRAVAPIAAADLDTWLDAQTISLRFFPSTSERPIGLEAPTAGLRAALDAATAP